MNERLRKLEDRLQLLEMPARYARALDDRDLAALLGLFCEDAHFGDVLIQVRGTEELRDLYQDVMGNASFTIHSTYVPVIERIEGDEAWAWVLGHVEGHIDGELRVMGLRYDDTYRRVGGSWRFARRFIRYYYNLEWTSFGEIGRIGERIRFRGKSLPADLPPPDHGK